MCTFKHILETNVFSIFHMIATGWISLDFIDDKSTLVNP